jgi:hypothetical protein
MQSKARGNEESQKIYMGEWLRELSAWDHLWARCMWFASPYSLEKRSLHLSSTPWGRVSALLVQYAMGCILGALGQALLGVGSSVRKWLTSGHLECQVGTCHIQML